DSRQIATGEDEGRFCAVGPAQPFGVKTQRSLIGSRAHDVTVDRLEETLDESWVQGFSVCEFVGGFEPVDAPVLSSDKTIEARRHVNRYARVSVCHRVALSSNSTVHGAARCPPLEPDAAWAETRCHASSVLILLEQSRTLDTPAQRKGLS